MLSELEYDVLVCGSGMAGITAAAAAAEDGLSVGVIEYFGEPGGIPVSGRLGSISGFTRLDQVAVGGFPRAFADRLDARGKALVQSGGSNINLPPTALVSEIFDLLDFYRIGFYGYSKLTGLEKTQDTVTSALVAMKEGVRRIGAKLFIDATGDGDAAALAGCPFMKGRPSDGKVQSATLIFIIGGLDRARMPEYMEIRKIWKSKVRQVPINHSVFQFVPHGENSSEIAVNMTHAVNADPLSSAGLTAMRRTCVKQAEYLLDFFRTEIPGFENAWISQFAPQMGVRDSRRILGDCVLTADDVLSGRRFEDEIALGVWNIDVHSPDGVHTGVGQAVKAPYGIPYRCITPKGVKNLLIAGRSISCDFEAFSSTRINAVCMAVGEFAGSAAREIISSGDIRRIDVKKIRAKMRDTSYRFFSAPRNAPALPRPWYDPARE
ncbi:MAG: FAD-dependent oxidoreductase [Lentisphaeria bacterium]|nr:FAD-dependent oxidoreductase [Lentisphaeria bacterium]